MLFRGVQRKGDFLTLSDQHLIDEELHAIADLNRTERSRNDSIIGGFGLAVDEAPYKQWTDDATAQRLAELTTMHQGRPPHSRRNQDCPTSTRLAIYWAAAA